MGWLEHRPQLVRLIRLAIVLAAASLTAGCFQPLYGTHTSVGGVPDSVHYMFAAVDVPAIKAPLGSPVERIAVNMRNALELSRSRPAKPWSLIRLSLTSTTTSPA
jgi:LPS-assembly lipoprotein